MIRRSDLVACAADRPARPLPDLCPASGEVGQSGISTDARAPLERERVLPERRAVAGSKAAKCAHVPSPRFGSGGSE